MSAEIVANNQGFIQTKATNLLGDPRQNSTETADLTALKDDLYSCINETIMYKATLEQRLLTNDSILGFTNTTHKVFRSFIEVNCSLLGDLGWLYRKVENKIKTLSGIDTEEQPEADEEPSESPEKKFITRHEMQTIVRGLMRTAIKEAGKRCSKTVVKALRNLGRQSRQRRSVNRPQRPANRTQQPRPIRSFSHMARYLPSARTVVGPNGESVELYGVRDDNGNVVEMPIDEIPLERLQFIARGLQQGLREARAGPSEEYQSSPVNRQSPPAHPSRIFNGRTFARSN